MNARWVRPLVAAYSCHTAGFLAMQLMLASHIFFALETEYTFKLNLVFYANVLAGLTLILGFVLTIPYLLSILREGEIVIQNEPSLIIELIPQFLCNGALLLIICMIIWANRQISLYHDFTLSILAVYGIIGFAIALVAFISRSVYHICSMIVGCTVLNIVVRRPHWFSDFSMQSSVSIALILWAYCLWRQRMYSENLVPIEIEIGRIKIGFVLLTVCCITSSWMTEFGFVCIGLVVLCSCVEYYWERQLGTLQEREDWRSN